jgi:hypothetical protein
VPGIHPKLVSAPNWRKHAAKPCGIAPILAQVCRVGNVHSVLPASGTGREMLHKVRNLKVSPRLCRDYDDTMKNHSNTLAGNIKNNYMMFMTIEKISRNLFDKSVFNYF